jgi:catechol 2,3-dioxygenase-like lactoylglutathione lyase family enzyme
MAEEIKPRMNFGKPLQIGIVVKDAHRTADLLFELLGIGPFRFVEWPTDRPDMKSVYHEESGDFRLLEAFTNFENIELELVQPLGGKSGYSDYLEERGEGIHHILFEVSDLDKVVDWFAEKGIPVQMGGTGNRPGTRWLHLDTVSLLGWAVELRSKVDSSDGKTFTQ